MNKNYFPFVKDDEGYTFFFFFTKGAFNLSQTNEEKVKFKFNNVLRGMCLNQLTFFRSIFVFLPQTGFILFTYYSILKHKIIFFLQRSVFFVSIKKTIYIFLWRSQDASSKGWSISAAITQPVRGHSRLSPDFYLNIYVSHFLGFYP